MLDTAHGTFKRDMVTAPSVTTKLQLTEEDLTGIRNKMDEIDFWGYPDVLEYEPRADGITGIVTPFISYYFMTTRGDVVKEVTWEDKYWDERALVTNLRDLCQLVREIIESTPEYKALPEPRGGYM